MAALQSNSTQSDLDFHNTKLRFPFGMEDACLLCAHKNVTMAVMIKILHFPLPDPHQATRLQHQYLIE